MIDLVIRAERACDPGRNYFGPAIIGIKNGQIVLFDKGFDLEVAALETISYHNEIVAPGFIDLHVHVYEWVTNFGVSPDKAGIFSGATTVVDQGSAGPWTVGGFEAFISKPSVTDVRCFMSANLAGALMGGMEGTTLHGPQMTRIEEIKKAYKRYPKLICGIKSHGESGGMSHWDTDVLKQAVMAGEECDLPLYVHTGELFPVADENRPAPESVVEKAIELLRPGDILAHVYSNMPDGVIGSSIEVPKYVHAAFKKGINFDIGYGINFSYRIARMMIESKLPPTTISSDLHGDFNAYHDFSKLDYSLAGAFNRLIGLGLPIYDAIKCVTYAPASILKSSHEIGTLAEGSTADLTILDQRDETLVMSDAEGHKLQIPGALVPIFVYKNGKKFETDPNMFPDLS